MTKTYDRRKLTPYEQSCADRAKAMWLKKKKNEGLKNQSDIADYMGMSPSGIGQYLNGVIPLNVKVIIKLAAYFGCDTRDIDPKDFYSEILNDEERLIISAYRSGDRRRKDMLVGVADLTLSQASHPGTDE